MEQKEDLVYIQRVLNGEPKAYAYLVEKYKHLAYTLALRIVKNEQDAEEVSQDAFMKAYKALNQFKKEALFSTWFYRIVYNTAISRTRKKQLKTQQLEAGHEQLQVMPVSQSFYHLVKADQKKYLGQAIDQLSSDDAVLINLYYIHEKDAGEISEIMHLTPVNVRVKLSRARKKLLVYLNKLLKNETKSML